MYRVADAALVALILAGLAWSAGLITISSAVFGFTVAFIMLAGAGIPGIVILALFFPASTHLSHEVRRRREKQRAREAEATGVPVPELAAEEAAEARPRLLPDWKQMAANGAVGCAFAAAYFLFEGQAQVAATAAGRGALTVWANLQNSFAPCSPLIAGMVAALGSAAADTASHEVGVTTRGGTYLLVGRRRVRAGTTGGVSALGTSVMVLTVAAFMLASWVMRMGSGWPFLMAVGVGGIIGNLLDSVVGELAERRYKAWGNNLTNLASTAVAGAAAFGLALWLG